MYPALGARYSMVPVPVRQRMWAACQGIWTFCRRLLGQTVTKAKRRRPGPMVTLIRRYLTAEPPMQPSSVSATTFGVKSEEAAGYSSGSVL